MVTHLLYVNCKLTRIDFKSVGISILEYNLNDIKSSNFKKSEKYTNNAQRMKCKRKKKKKNRNPDGKNTVNDKKGHYFTLVQLIYDKKQVDVKKNDYKKHVQAI